MLKKFKEFIKNMSYKRLIGIIIIETVIIFKDVFIELFSFLNQFNSETLDTIKMYYNNFNVLYEKYKYFFYVIYVCSFSLIGFKLYLKKEKIKVMIVNSLGNTKVNILTRYLEEDTSFEKDFGEAVKLLENNISEYKQIVKKLDDTAEEFMSAKKENNYAFAGILHTPFALRLGYKIGDETYFKLFHKKRKEDKFKLLKEKEEYCGNYSKLNVEKRLAESDELIVSISTTFPITEMQLEKFNVSNSNYLKFETLDKGFDIIYSEKQVNEYKDLIFKEIRKITSSKKIKVIRLCISSSVAFTFALGQGFSEKYDSKVIIYNYENQQYTWGIKLFEDAENSIEI